jgi:uncharacterized protein YkwD
MADKSPLNNIQHGGMSNTDDGRISPPSKKTAKSPAEHPRRAKNPLRWVLLLVAAVAISLLATVLAGYRFVPSNFANGDPFLVRTKPTAVVATNTTGTVSATSTAAAVYGEADKITLTNLVNDYRIKNGAAKLTPDATLAASAQAHADDMFTRHYFSHADPEGRTPYDRLNNKSYTKVGENIIQGNVASGLTPAKILEQWIASPPHKETLLAPDWKITGVGVRQGVRINPDTNTQETVIIWVQIFALKG